MSLTRALAYVKALDKRLETEISSGLYISVAKGLNEKRVPHIAARANSGITISAVESSIKANFDRITSSIANRATVKEAILKANNETPVSIGSKSMTIAQAVEQKQSVKFRAGFLAVLKQQYLNATATVKQLQDKLEMDKNSRLEKAFVGVDMKTLSKDSLEVITKALVDEGTPSFIDQANLQAYITKLEAELEEFTLNVDYVLSEVNSRTNIEVQLV